MLREPVFRWPWGAQESGSGCYSRVYVWGRAVVSVKHLVVDDKLDVDVAVEAG